jgi:hypothetical protein
VSTQWEAQVDHDGGFFVSNPDFTNLEGPFYTSWGTSRYTTGWVTDVPGAWQAALGGNALAGHCCAATISSTSFGPSAFAFTLQQVGQTIPLPITPLLYYTQQNPTIGDCAVPNPAEVYWHCHDNPRGMVIPGGYGTLLYFSQHGIGNTISPGVIYGEGSDWTTSAPREEAHDPAVAGRTYHAYPYRYQFLAYRLSDLAAVKAGQKQPWEVIPYARWYVPLPPVPDDGPYSAKSVGGMAYDPVRRRLYVVATSAEDGVRPLIHVFAVAPPPTTPLSSPENLRLTCAD